jgi:hypothetical protein
MSYMSQPSIPINKPIMPRPSQRKERVRPRKLFVIHRELVTVKRHLVLDDFSPVQYGVNYLDMEGLKIHVPGSLKVGRDPEECAVTINNKYVSREHFEIATDDIGRYCLMSHAQNQIKLNGEKIDPLKKEKRPLIDGDIIEVEVSKNKYLPIIFRAEARMQTIPNFRLPQPKERLSN